MILRFRTLVYLAFLFLAIPSGPPAPLASQAAASNSIILDNVKIVNSVEPYCQDQMDIVIRDGVIAEIRKAGEFDSSSGLRRLDLAGKFVIPGLIEGHVHLRILPDRQLSCALRWGITSIRSMADDASYLLLLKKAIAEGRLEGPDIYYAAAFGGRKLFEEDLRASLYASDDYEIGQAPWMQMVTEASDIPKMVQRAKDCGATGIKLLNYLTPGQVEALVKSARAFGLKVWSHPHLSYTDGKKIARSKVDLITHTPMLLALEDWNLRRDGGLSMTPEHFANGRLDEILTAMKENNIFFEPTFSVFFEQLNMREPDAAGKAKSEMAIEMARRAYALGLRFVAGTDRDLPQKADEKPYLFEEIRTFAEGVGLTPVEALKTATSTGAVVLGIEKTRGSIEVGKAADLVILSRDPSVDVKNLESVELVIKDGRILNRTGK
jgi:imidazolonepropionase-like amidohydrolase